VQRAIRAFVRECPAVMSEHASDAIAVAIAGARRAE
jgi:Holliday junction resolvasome RuvABC endonuclease subunit